MYAPANVRKVIVVSSTTFGNVCPNVGHLRIDLESYFGGRNEYGQYPLRTFNGDLSL